MKSSIEKLEELIFSGGDVCVPEIYGDEWIIIDNQENEYYGKTLEDACRKIPQSLGTAAYVDLEIGDEFNYLGQIWKKMTTKESMNSEGQSWIFKSSDVVSKMK